MFRMEYKDYNSLMMDRSGSIGYICDLQNHELIYLSKAGMELYGLKSQADYLGRPCYRVLHGLDAPCASCTNRKLTDCGESHWEYYNQFLERWFSVTASLIHLEQRPCRMAIATDITSRKQEVNALTQQLSMEDTLIYCLNTLTRESDLEVAVNSFLQTVGRYYQANRAYIFEFDRKRQLLNNTFEWCAPDVSAEIENLQNIPISVAESWLCKFEACGEFAINSLEQELDSASEDYQILQAQGIQSLLAAPLRRDGRIVGFIGVDDPRRCAQDLTLLKAVSSFVLEELEKRRLMAELERLSYVDLLTGLRNRNQYARVLQAFESAAPSSLGVIVLDINGLKGVNDAHGYEYGDQVLKQTAAILRRHFSDHLYRIGGDEFVILCRDISKEDFLERLTALRASFEADHLCNVSIGFAWNFDADSVDANALVHQAEEMRHAEKQSYYHSVLKEGRSVSRAGLTDAVLNEIQNHQFLVYYQPQVHIKTGAVIGAEALVRKLAEDGSVIPPGKFLPFYEAAGVISHIDLFVMRTACATLRNWIDQGHSLNVSVNFSRSTLLEPNIAEVLSEICAEAGVSPASITIEVTESIGKMDHEHLKDLIQTLKTVGFHVSLDDFGSEYSNLAILAALDFDEVKFDRSLVSSLEENAKSRVVIKSAMNLCRELEGTSSLAEGIETRGQLELLTHYQCDYGQGYYFSRPLPLDQFNAFLSGS